MNRANFYGDDASRFESSSESSDEDELLLRAELRKQEHRAQIELELCKAAPVAFTLRTNIEFDGLIYGLDAPIPCRVISFSAKEFLQIKKRFNQNWWIGRLVRIGAPFGFIPSPAKLETLRHTMQSNLSQILLSEVLQQTAAVAAANATPSSDTVHLTPTNMNTNGHILKPWSSNITNGSTKASTDKTSKNVFFGSGVGLSKKGLDIPLNPGIESVGGTDTSQKGVTGNTGSLPGVTKKKQFFRKGFTGLPYELVPNMRPVVVVGPALKGFEVTDMMQKALFDAMKKAFEGRLIFTRVTHDISMWKRMNALLNIDKKALTDRTRGRQIITLLEVQREIERIFDLATSMQLILLDCDSVNHPSQIAKSCLAPIIVYIKIASIRVLHRLIKNRGKNQKNMNVQTAASEKLLQCPQEIFDLVIEQNNLEGASEALATYLESYMLAVHCYGDVSKAERFLGTHFGAKPNEPKIVRPMVPGRPGLNIATPASISAGFTVAELSGLAGDRMAGVLGMGIDGDIGTGEDENSGQNPNGDDEEKEKEDNEEKEKDGTDGAETQKRSTKKRIEYEAAVAADRLNKSEGTHGILKTTSHLTSDRAHALAIAEAAVKNANQARIEIPVATVGLHQSAKSAHSDPSGTPKVYASRSSRQAKQRQEELEAARQRAEKAAIAAAEARAATGAQRQQRRLKKRLAMEQQQIVTFGGTMEENTPLSSGPVLNRHRGDLSDEESMPGLEASAPGSNLRRNTSSIVVPPRIIKTQAEQRFTHSRHLLP